jgi:hypothetical protein
MARARRLEHPNDDRSHALLSARGTESRRTAEGEKVLFREMRQSRSQAPGAGQDEARLRPPKLALSRDQAPTIPDTPETAKNPTEIVEEFLPMSRGEQPLVWQAVNEVTDKLMRAGSATAIGFTMLIEGKGWHGRVKDERGEFSFGPSTRKRARGAVEAWLRHEPIEFQGDEGAWRGTCDRLVNLIRVSSRMKPAVNSDSAATSVDEPV